MKDSIRFRSWLTIVTFLLSLSCLFTSSQSFTIRNVVGNQIVVLGKHLYTKLQEPMSHAQKYISTGMVAIAANLSFDGIKSAMNNQKNTIQSQKVALKTKLSNLKQNIIYQHRNRHSSTSFIREAVRNVGPSVVRIDCDCENDTPLNLIGSSSTSSSFKNNDKSSRLSGSGFIVSEDGYVMTNAHVVEKAKSIIITLSNGRSFKANLVAFDELIDLAVLKIDVRSNSNSNNIKLKKAPLGDSSKLQAGDWLIAVGCPAGLDFTVSLGIVSSPKRSAYEVGAPHLKGSYIQTDTSLNVGNSGGPLVNDYGEVVGINTMIRDGGGVNNNEATTGFAIPINRALEVFDVLKEGRKPTHAFFGLELTNITPDIARIYNENPNTPIKVPNNIKGALIVGIAPTSPAADAIFRQGDVIIEINGVSIKDMSDAEYCLDKSNIGEYCHVKVIRGGDSESNNNNNNVNNVPVPLDVYVVPQDLLVLLEEQQKLKSSAEEEESIRNRNKENSNSENENEEDDEEEGYDDSFIESPTITDRQKSSDNSSKDKAEGKNKAESKKAKTGSSSAGGVGGSGGSTNQPSTSEGDTTLKVPPSPPKWRKQTFKLWNHQR